MSGGQRQRIAIARSIIKQPAILILDEATSSIDVQGEQIVQAALDRLAENRTTIMIAHRLSTIRKADHIIVLRQGCKIEEGTHQQLLSNENGLYSGLTRAQKLEEDDTAPETPSMATGSEPLEVVISNQLSRQTRSDSISGLPTKDVESAGGANGYRNKGFFATAGRLIYERRPQWLLYGIAILAAMGAGGRFTCVLDRWEADFWCSCQCYSKLAVCTAHSSLQLRWTEIDRCS